MENKLHILLCEDEESLGMLVREYQQAKGYDAELYLDGEAGYKAFMKTKFDMCLLDVMMPKMDGFSLAKEIRLVNAEVPIIFLTAKNLKEDILEGFKLGADDYLTKPFSVTELLARLRVAQRRISSSAAKPEDSVFRNGNLTIDYGAGCAFLKGEALKLTPTEYKLLCLLAKDVGKVLTHTYLTDKIWGSSWDSDMASLRVHMATLRKKLEKNQDTQYIQTHIGIGYRMLKIE